VRHSTPRADQRQGNFKSNWNVVFFLVPVSKYFALADFIHIFSASQIMEGLLGENGIEDKRLAS